MTPTHDNEMLRECGERFRNIESRIGTLFELDATRDTKLDAMRETLIEARANLVHLVDTVGKMAKVSAEASKKELSIENTLSKMQAELIEVKRFNNLLVGVVLFATVANIVQAFF